MEAVKNKL